MDKDLTALYTLWVTCPSEYEFVFDLVMKEPVARGVFKKYLINTKSKEIIDFLDTVREYKNWVLGVYSGNDNRSLEFVNKVNIIATDYIKNGSIDQLNLDAKRIEIFNKRVAYSIDKSKDLDQRTEQGRNELISIQYGIFDDIEQHVLYTLKNDSFRRCIRSIEWKTFIKQATTSKASFTNVASIIEKVGDKHARYSLEDIKHPVITSKDFEFTKEVCEDHPYWIPVKHNKAKEEDIEVYKSERNFIIDSAGHTLGMSKNKDAKNFASSVNANKYQQFLDSGLKRLKNPQKFVFTLDHNFEVVLACLTSSDLTDRSKIFTYSGIGYNNADKITSTPSSVSFVVGVTMPFPFSHREMPCLCSARKSILDNKDTIHMIIRPYNDSHVEKLSVGNQRSRTMQCWSFTKIRENLTRVTVVLFMEFGGWFSAKSVQGVMQKSTMSQQIDLVIDYKNNIKSTLSSMNKNGYPRPQDLGLLKSYEENLELDGFQVSFYQRNEMN
ncbi:Regulator of G protein signaling domain protein [compost metagenome]